MAAGFRSLPAAAGAIRSRIRCEMSVQPSFTRSSSANPPVWRAVKFTSHRCCQPGVASVGEPVADRSGGCCGRRPTTACAGTRTAPRHRLRQVRDALHRGRAGADDADPLVGELVHRRAGSRVAAGVVVVPPAGVEGVAAERARSRGCPGSFGAVQRAGAHAHELGGQLVAAVGRDDPARRCLVPLELGDLGGEQRVVVEAELSGDAPAVLEDLRAVHVLLGRHVPGLFEQRQVDHRRRVALRAGVAVPVPGAAEVAALLDDADVDAGLLQPGPDHQAGEAAADERHGPVVGPWRPFGPWRVRIVEVVRELLGELEVLVVAVRAQPLVPLCGVLAPQRFGVNGGHHIVPSCHSCGGRAAAQVIEAALASALARPA